MKAPKSIWGYLGLALMLTGGAESQDSEAKTSDPRALHLFFTPSDRLTLDLDLTRRLESVGGRLIPHLLVDETEAIMKDPKRFSRLAESVKTLESIVGKGNLGLPVIDTQGLVLARRYRISQTPAFVFERDAFHVHIAYGTGCDIKDLVSCRR